MLIIVNGAELDLGRFRFFESVSVIGYFFHVGRLSVSVFIKISVSVSVSVFLRNTIYVIFKVISTACARPVCCVCCMHFTTLCQTETQVSVFN
jgi:hypothetical protein